MTTAERRLEGLRQELSARERAFIQLRWWADGTEPDERLRKYTPPEQEAERDRLVRAVEDATNEVHQYCGIWIEWLIQTEMMLAWLESLVAHRSRIRELEQALKTQGVRARESVKRPRAGTKVIALSPMPGPGRAFRRDIKRLYGVELGQEPPAPQNWDEAVKRLTEAVRSAISIRWQELRAADAVFVDLEEHLGHRFVHHEVAAVLEVCRGKILELHESVQAISGPHSLPDPEQRFLDSFHKRVAWDDLAPSTPPGRSKWNPRDGLYPALREEVEAAEEEWGAMLVPRIEE